MYNCLSVENEDQMGDDFVSSLITEYMHCVEEVDG